MERLRKKDQDEGVTVVPLTEAQRAQIAESATSAGKDRRTEILARVPTMVLSVDVAERETLDQQHRRELEHLTSAPGTTRRVEKVRRGEFEKLRNSGTVGAEELVSEFMRPPSSLTSTAT